MLRFFEHLCARGRRHSYIMKELTEKRKLVDVTTVVDLILGVVDCIHLDYAIALVFYNL